MTSAREDKKLMNITGHVWHKESTGACLQLMTSGKLQLGNCRNAQFSVIELPSFARPVRYEQGEVYAGPRPDGELSFNLPLARLVQMDKGSRGAPDDPTKLTQWLMIYLNNSGQENEREVRHWMETFYSLGHGHFGGLFSKACVRLTSDNPEFENNRFPPVRYLCIELTDMPPVNGPVVLDQTLRERLYSLLCEGSDIVSKREGGKPYAYGRPMLAGLPINEDPVKLAAGLHECIKELSRRTPNHLSKRIGGSDEFDAEYYSTSIPRGIESVQKILHYIPELKPECYADLLQHSHPLHMPMGPERTLMHGCHDLARAILGASELLDTLGEVIGGLIYLLVNSRNYRPLVTLNSAEISSEDMANLQKLFESEDYSQATIMVKQPEKSERETQLEDMLLRAQAAMQPVGNPSINLIWDLMAGGYKNDVEYGRKAMRIAKDTVFISCPFHEEDTPSLAISRFGDQHYSCMGCGASGKFADLRTQVRPPQWQLNNEIHKLLNPAFVPEIIIEEPPTKEQ